MKRYDPINPIEIKRRKLLEGMKETIIDGEEQYLLDVNNILLLGIQVTANKDEGITAIKNLGLAKTIVEQMKEEDNEKYLAILDNENTSLLCHSVILSNDITEQLCAMTKLLYLASSKAIGNNDK